MTRRRGGDESSRDELSRLLSALRGTRTQTQVAQLVGFAQQVKVSRVERGTVLLTGDDCKEAADYALALGATPDQAARAAELTRVKAASQLTGRAVLVRVATAIQERIGRLEAGATLIRGWEPAALTGTLQTEAYTAAVIAGEDDGADPGPAWWEARRRNVARITDTSRVWRYVVSEAALRWRLGSRKTMDDELDHLIALSRLPNVELGVVDLDTPKPFYAPRGFYLYDGPGGRTVSTATDVGTSFLDDIENLAYYEALWVKVEAAAVWRDEARELIGQVRRRR